MHLSFVSTTPGGRATLGGFDNKFSIWRWEFDNKLQPERLAIDKLMCTGHLGLQRDLGRAMLSRNVFQPHAGRFSK